MAKQTALPGPGSELDALVAEARGWRKKSSGLYRIRACGYKAIPGGVFWNSLTEHEIRDSWKGEGIFSPSTLWSDAGPLLGLMLSDGARVSLEGRPDSDPHWGCGASRGSLIVLKTSAYAMVSICVAFLRHKEAIGEIKLHCPNGTWEVKRLRE